MSLISEALKKAQRMRTAEPAAGGGASGGPVGRGRGGSSASTVWMIAGAIIAVCAAVVITVFLVRPSPRTLEAAKTASAPAATNTASVPAATPVATAPAAPPSAVPSSTAPARAPEPVPVRAEPAPVAISEAAMPPPSLKPAAIPRATPPPGRLPVAAENAPADPRIQTFIDAIKVAGIRSSGSDSKVLMNDRVYRVNDIVDRSLNLRLTDVEADSLTFVDANNVVYTKNF